MHRRRLKSKLHNSEKKKDIAEALLKTRNTTTAKPRNQRPGTTLSVFQREIRRQLADKRNAGLAGPEEEEETAPEPEEDAVRLLSVLHSALQARLAVKGREQILDVQLGVEAPTAVAFWRDGLFLYFQKTGWQRPQATSRRVPSNCQRATKRTRPTSITKPDGSAQLPHS